MTLKKWVHDPLIGQKETPGTLTFLPNSAAAAAAAASAPQRVHALHRLAPLAAFASRRNGPRGPDLAVATKTA